MSFQNNVNSANRLAGKISSLSRSDDILGKLIDKTIDSAIKVPSVDNIGKNISDLASKRKKRNTNHHDVFKDLIHVVESFFSEERPTSTDPNKPFLSKQMIQQISIAAMNKTLNESKQIIMDAVMQTLFVGDGICGTDKTFQGLNFTECTLHPYEFDFLNALTVDPNSSTGKIVYEPEGSLGAVNRDLYSAITGDTVNITSKNGDSMFKARFDQYEQKFTFSEFSPGGAGKLEDFMLGYYGAIDHVNIDNVLNTAVYMTLHGDGKEPLAFDISTNILNRLLAKLCGYCGNSDDNKKGLGQSPQQQFNETDDDIEFYFDFDDVEGIDLDDEADRLNKVLRFRDCDNFTVPINASHYDNFVYLEGQSTAKKVDNAILNAAIDAHNQSGSDSIPMASFHINLINSLILNLPKSLIQAVLSPKYFLPIIIVYKAVNNTLGVVVEDVKVVMKKMWKLFNAIITKLLWRFRVHFWDLAKPHLYRFLAKLLRRIILNKQKRYLVIIAALIALLLGILNNVDFGSCKGMFDAINLAIDALIAGSALLPGLSIPGFLLSFSNFLPGKSTDIMKSQIFGKLENHGVNTGALFDKQTTNLQALVSSMVDGHQEHEDSFGYVSTGNNLTVLPGPTGPIIVPPGLITSHGKNF